MWRKARANETDDAVTFITANEYQVDKQISRTSLGISGVVDLSRQRGGIALDICDEQVEGVGLYTFGVPADGFADSSIGYILLMILSPVRRYRSFLEGLAFMLQELKSGGSVDLQFKARKDSQYEQRLYQKFSRIIGVENNMAGHPSLVFSCTIEEALRRLSRYEKPCRKNGKQKRVNQE